MAPIVLLGPQRHHPTVGETLASLRLKGPFAVITAGWQEREAEIEELDAHLGQASTNLMLHRRAEEVFSHAPEFREAHRAHQERLKRLQEIYRIRLDQLQESVRRLMGRRGKPEPDLLEPEIDDAIDNICALDRRHQARIAELNEEFATAWGADLNGLIMDHHYELEEILEGSAGLIIAGGHVAVLLNRIRLLKLAPLMKEIPIVAWSAGAMVLGDRIVLFHDNPPQGKGNAELLESGLGLFDDLLPLPHAKHRLHLKDPVRVSLFARRFGDAHCIAFDDRSRLDRRDHRWFRGKRVRKLQEDGHVRKWEGS